MSMQPMVAAPLPLRAGHLPLRQVIDLYMQHWTGADTTRTQRLTCWVAQLGDVALQDLTDDHVHAALEALATRNARYYSGKDEAGRPVLNAKRKLLAPATVNRYLAALSAVLTWSAKKRIPPKGWVHPCRSVERRPERNERTRFLSDDERERLLQACRASRWPRLYVLVLMALTTGARRGELLGLTWADVDLARCEATLTRTKNGSARVLPLVPAVVDELKRFAAGPAAKVFASPRCATRTYTFEPRFAEALKAAKVRDFTFHSLRHSCASLLAKNGATLLEIADVLGHRQLQMTKRYSHLATGHKAELVNRVLGGIQ